MLLPQVYDDPCDDMPAAPDHLMLARYCSRFLGMEPYALHMDPESGLSLSTAQCTYAISIHLYANHPASPKYMLEAMPYRMHPQLWKTHIYI